MIVFASASVSNHFSPMKWRSERSTSSLLYSVLFFRLTCLLCARVNCRHRFSMWSLATATLLCNSLSMLHLFHYFSIYFFFFSFSFISCVLSSSSSQPSFLSLLLRAIYFSAHFKVLCFQYFQTSTTGYNHYYRGAAATAIAVVLAVRSFFTFFPFVARLVVVCL